MARTTWITAAAGVLAAGTLLMAAPAQARTAVVLQIGTPAPVYTQPYGYGYGQVYAPAYQPNVVYSPGYVVMDNGWGYPGPRGHVIRRDRDRDGVPDRFDRDRDGDGVPNWRDRRPDNGRRY